MGSLKLKAFVTISMLTMAGAAEAKNPSFRPVTEAPFVAEPVGSPNDFSLGLSFSSLALMGRPYSTKASGTEKDFRYQIPTSLGLEFSYQILAQLEVGLGLSYLSYESRADQAAGVNSVAFQTVKYKAYPVTILGRYRFGNPMGWAPEAEAGLAYVFGTTTVRSTNVSASESSSPANGFMGYGAMGAGFAWVEDFSLHAAVGYAYLHQENVTYLSKVTQKSMSGIFSKALIRYKF